jgi:molecular chaperone GrpE
MAETMEDKDMKRDQDNKSRHNEGDPADNKAENGTTTDASAEQDQKSGGAGSDPEKKYSDLNDKYLRLYSEFDNYRKRTLREKSEILRTAGEDILKAVIPAIDDFERAIRANEKIDDAATIKDGFRLIYNKLQSALQQKGLTPFDSVGQPFDPELMEAITHIPADESTKKGTVIDEVEKGYKLGDKVIRFAKVVVAQ